MVVQALVDICGNEPLSMHATPGLIRLYAPSGFREIGEHGFPESIGDRFSFADGELEGANVSPVQRPATASPASLI